jgi:hypothetical protein
MSSSSSSSLSSSTEWIYAQRLKHQINRLRQKDRSSIPIPVQVCANDLCAFFEVFLSLTHFALLTLHYTHVLFWIFFVWF